MLQEATPLNGHAGGAAAIAAGYARRGWSPIPIPPREKAPTIPDWQRTIILEPDIGQWFSHGSNIGVLNGAPSGWLVDVDLDHELARELADQYLPTTAAEFGRAGSKRSHRLYYVVGEVETLQKRLPKVDGKAPMIVELRSTGSQTVFPGSIHPSGERVEWDSDGEPASVPAALLVAAVNALADEVVKRLGLTRPAKLPALAPEASALKATGPQAVADVRDRARAYVAKIPGAVSGQGGHNATFHVACVLVIGFGLDRDTALELLHEWNTTCQPPWEDHELEHKIDSAFKADGERGYLLNGSASVAANLPERNWTEQARVLVGDKYYRADDPRAKGCQNSDNLKPSPTFAGIDAADMEACVNEPVDWLVTDVFSADQPTLFGARSKAGKTTQLSDLTAAFGTGTPWLGAFAVPQKRRTLFITGEANNRAISRRLDRALRARGKTLADLREMVRVEALDFPQLPRIKDQEAVAKTISDYGIQAVVVDPLYRGLAGLDSGKVTEIGGAIIDFTQACRPAATIISHHCIKNAAREYGRPPELEDMTGAGVAECCGNWWLIGRNAPYEFDGMHDLCVTFGGRDEQAGARRILFNEREWTFEVENLHHYREAAANDAEAERQRERDETDQRQVDMARAKLKATLANQKTPLSKTIIRDSCGATRRWFEPAFAAMLRDQDIVARPYRDAVGRLQPAGFMLREHAANCQFEGMPDGPGRSRIPAPS